MKRYTLYAHQHLILEPSLKASHLVAAEPGTGKTLVGIELAKHFKAHPIRTGKTLVVTQLSLVESAWMEDLKKFAPELKVANLWASTPANRKKVCNDALKRNVDIMIVNFEGFKKLMPWLAAQRFDALIIDESSALKSPKTDITKSLVAFSYGVPRSYPMSGTPMPNSALDIYHQVQIVKPGLLGHNFYQFRARFFQPTGYQGYQWKIIPGCLEQIMQTIQPYASFIKKEDCLDLPPKVFTVRKHVMSPELRRAYDQLIRDKLLPLVEGHAVMALNVLSEIMKLRQLTSGWAYDEQKQVHNFSPGKLNLLTEVVEELGANQAIIWVQFRHDATKLKNELGARATVAIGGMNPTDLKFALDEFRAGRYQFLIAHPQCVGHGVTLVNASYAIYYGLSYSLEEFLQSQDRIHRIGTPRKCTYISLLAEDSIDEVIYAALNRKEQMANAALSYLRAYRPGTAKGRPAHPRT